MARAEEDYDKFSADLDTLVSQAREQLDDNDHQLKVVLHAWSALLSQNHRNACMYGAIAILRLAKQSPSPRPAD
jgi:hypothetical protein